MEFKEATEPTNIIWENLHIGLREKVLRRLYFVIVIILTLSATFCIIFYVEGLSAKINEKYTQVDCDQINQIYKQDQLLSHSINYWIDYYKEDHTKIKKVSGVLNCFCSAQKQTLGKDL